jgi:uncharacterized membrane protein YeaQ/YmgE (transglycosylase-associated protein family)
VDPPLPGPDAGGGSSMPDLSRARRVFLSYARRDANKVETLEEGLRLFGVDVWLDDALVGGHEWWQAILSEIRVRDVFVQAVSPAGIESEACTRERDYARALGKPVLPVVVDLIDTSRLPDDLSRLQLVAYIEPEPEHAFRLARALASCPPAPPLPEPLPTPPEVPVSYLQGLDARVRARSLTFDDQLALVARLEAALERDGERVEALNLLRRLSEREDLYHDPAVRIERLISKHRPAPVHVESGADLPEAEPGLAPEPRLAREPQPSRDSVPPVARPITLACSVLLIAALAALAGGALREVTGPEDGAEAATKLLALILARTIGWALIVAAVAAVIARHVGTPHPSAAAVRGLVAGIVAGLVGALVHGLLAYVIDTATPPASRLLGLAITGAVAGVYFGRSLHARAAGLIGGLAGGVVAGVLVYDWPGNDAPFVAGTLSWVLHAVPICVGAVGLALLRRRRLARRSEGVSPGTAP